MTAIRGLRPDDAATCVAVSAARGWNTTEARWRTMLALGDGYGVDVDGHLAGTVILTRFGPALASVAMMLVLPDHARCGIGRALMEHVLAEAGDATVFLCATEMGHRLYARLGFVDAGVSVRLEGRARATRAACAGLRPATARDLASVVALDAEAHGALRAPLLEQSFAEADSSVVVERDGHVAAFGFARPSLGRRVLGPVVARDDDGASAVASALADRGSAPLCVDLAPGEEALRSWAQGAGLMTTSTTAVMVLGGKALPGRRALVRALASRAHG